MAYRTAMNHRIPLIVAAILTLLGCSAEQPEQITFTVDPTRIERGAVVARGLAACGVCHGDKPTPDAPLSGGR
ncbi:MAG: hypothetical protein RL417_502, partial [Pseudomonadota bacterium]